MNLNFSLDEQISVGEDALTYEGFCMTNNELDYGTQDNDHFNLKDAGSGEERMMEKTQEETENHPFADGENEVTVMQSKYSIARYNVINLVLQDDRYKHIQDGACNAEDYGVTTLDDLI